MSSTPDHETEKALATKGLELTLTKSIDANARPACFKNGVQEVLFVLTVTMAIAMSSFTVGSTQVITDTIGVDLGMTSAEITWINASTR